MNSIWSALAQAQAEIGKIPETGRNPHFNSRFMELDTILSICLPILRANGLVLYQAPTYTGEGAALRSLLVHVESGEMVEDTLPLPPLPDMQKLGGAITYARRYMLVSQLGLKALDDDGNTATGRGLLVQNQPQASSHDEELSRLFDKTPPNVSPWAGVTEGCKEWGAHVRQLHTDSEHACTERMYGYLASLIDGITEKGAHRDILCRLAGDEVDKENRPGSKMVSLLIDKLAERSKDKASSDPKATLPNPNYSKQTVGYIKELYTALQLAAIPA